MAKRFRILVVEDGKENVAAAKRYFDMLEIDVDYAGTYRKAIGLARENNYDGAIIDSVFPMDENGKIEWLGLRLGGVLGTYEIPCVFLFGLQIPFADVYLDKAAVKTGIGCRTVEKNESRAWGFAFNVLRRKMRVY